MHPTMQWLHRKDIEVAVAYILCFVRFMFALYDYTSSSCLACHVDGYTSTTCNVYYVAHTL